MAITTTVGKVTIPFAGTELTATPGGTGNANVDGTSVPIVALYNPDDPTHLLGVLPVGTGLLSSPAAPTVTGAGGAVAASYQVVALSGGSDGIPSPATSFNGTTPPNTTVSWLAVPGATGYRVLRGGQVLVTVPAGQLTFVDTLPSGSAYTASTTQPLAAQTVRLVDASGTVLGTTLGGLNAFVSNGTANPIPTNPREFTAQTDSVGLGVVEYGPVNFSATNATVMNSGTVNILVGRFKTVYLTFTTGPTFASASTATAQPFVSRAGPILASNGAFASPTPNILLNAARTFATSVTSIANGSTYRWTFDSTAGFADLQCPDPFIGLQLTFTVAPNNAWAGSVWFEAY